MDKKMLENQTAFITGSSRGIGFACAELLAQHGANIILHSRKDEQLLDERKAYLESTYGAAVSTVLGDFGDPKDVTAIYKHLQKEHERLDILVNNAGTMKPGLLGMIDSETAQHIFDVNALGVLFSMQMAAKWMKQHQQGSIINLSSYLGLHGVAGQTVYSGTKAAVIGMTRTAAVELASAHIRVNCVAPGFIDTEMTKDLPRELVKNIKMGRIGTPEDVAKAVFFFASPLSEYITGQTLSVDGAMVV